RDCRAACRHFCCRALRILAKHHFKKLPVVNQAGRVVGVISRGDIMRQITDKLLNS
ncbi:MAG: CBS domain-containing protein, partial [Bacillus sp. (in: Bacteria)]|nr:CBS domain-containing protein [Bacillus sp. (in: firmicutes)]